MTAAEIIELVHERDQLLARIAEIDAAIGGAAATAPPTPHAIPGLSSARRPKGHVSPNGRGWRWQFSCRSYRYTGQTVKTREEGEAGLEAALDAFMRTGSVPPSPVAVMPVRKVAPPPAAAAPDPKQQQYLAAPGGRRKRPHGAGSVFHRGGLWSIRWLDETGTRRFLSGIETAARAEQVLDEMIAKRTDALVKAGPPKISQKRSEAGRRNVSKRWSRPTDPPTPPAPAAVPAPPPRKRGERRCKRCGELGHFANGPFHPEAARANRLAASDSELPTHVTPAEDEPPEDRPVTPPAEEDDPGDAEVNISANSNWKPRTVRPPLIRRDDPIEHPVIVDLGGVDVVALEVGPATKATTRVRWQAGPGAWAADAVEIVRSTVLRDATDAEVQQDQSVDAEDPDVEEAAASA